MNSKPLSKLLAGCMLLAGLQACQGDFNAPVIDGVWMNMVNLPVEKVPCAYPGQALCIRGEHLGDLSRVIVNGTDINLNTLFVYESSTAVTFTLPTDVKTEGDYIRVVTKWGMADYPFIVRPTAEKPEITAFSATTLVPGRTLTITGTNLEGATDVWLPLAFDGTVECKLDGEQVDGNSVNVVIPGDVAFASGRCEIVMEKYDAGRDLYYTEKVISEKTDFRN